MGRPALGPKIEVRVAPDDLARIDGHVGARERPAFIREAIKRELQRRDRAARDSAGRSED